MKSYNKRTWLNAKKSASTGSVTCFHGKSPWDKKTKDAYNFVEVSDCHGSIRLHQTNFESQDVFYKKIELLRDELTSYLKFLKKEIK